MSNPKKPLEQQRRLGNPGQRPLPPKSQTMALEPGYVEPLRPLGEAGQQLWDRIFGQGELWISGRTDAVLLQITCEQMDRRVDLIQQLRANDHDRSLHMSINDLEKLISSNLGLLGLSPSDRSRLGVAEVKAESELQQMIARARNHRASAGQAEPASEQQAAR